MEKRLLGKSGLEVPVVGMGTWQTFDVSGPKAEENARVIVDRALEGSANFFDSSPMYGQAERVLGKALQGRREQVLVATKVWARSLSEGRSQIERALNFFGGHVELYQIHNLASWREHLVALERLIKRGMEMDDELDAVRLMLDDMRAKDGQPPLVTDRERREPHLRARTALRMQEDEDNGEVDDDDDFTKGELDYMHNLGIDEDAYFAEQPKAAKPAKRRNLRVVQDE